MAAQCLLSTVRRLLAPAAIVVFLVCRGWSAEPEQKAASAETTAARLVRAALESELAGDNKCRDALLRQALDDSPNDASANWQLGQVRMQGEWRSPADVERAAEQDKRLAQYRPPPRCGQKDRGRPGSLGPLVQKEPPGRPTASALADRRCNSSRTTPRRLRR